jgi:hypothetical protein
MRLCSLIRLRRTLLAAAVALFVLLALSDSPASARTVTFTATVRAAAIDFEGEVFVFVGDIRSRRLGTGVFVNTTRGEGVTGRRTGDVKLFTPTGRIDARLLSIFTTQPDGSVRNDGFGVITRGTGRWRGATGYFDVASTLDPAQPDKTTVFMQNGRIFLPDR